MRAEKQFLLADVQSYLADTPYLILVDFTGLNVAQMSELRQRLAKAQAELHVVKNSILKRAVQKSGIIQGDCEISGPTAVVVSKGQGEVTSAAKVLTEFAVEFEKPRLKVGFVGERMLSAEQLGAVARLPGQRALRAQLLGLMQAPAQRFVRALVAKQSEFLSVLRQYQEKREKKQ